MRYRVLLATALLGLGACHSDRATAPRGDVAGLYVLRSVNSQVLPAPGNGPEMADYLIIADTIRLHADGSGEEVRVVLWDGIENVQADSLELTFTRRSDGLIDFAYACQDPNTLRRCIAPPHFIGLRTDTGLRVVSSSMYRTPMEFVPVGPLMWK